MAKKYIIYANGKDLALAPVTQNENGKYYRNSAGTYFKPILSEFDNASLPSGYKTYIGGSHAKYVSNTNRNPIDFSLVAGTVMTMNVDVKILSSTLSDGSWVKVGIVGTDIILAFVHTYRWANTGTIVKAGNQICQIAPQSITSFAPHLHMDEWANKGRKVRGLILNGDFNMGKAIKGKRYEFTNTDKLNVRDVPDGKQVVMQLPEGKKAVGLALTDGVSAGGYVWNLYAGNEWGGWVADNWSKETTRAVTDINGKAVDLAEVQTLKAEINRLTGELVASQEALKMAEDRVKFLEEDKKTWEGEIEKLEKEVLDAKDLAKRFEAQYIEVVTELNELKAGRDNWLNRLADMLHKLFSGSK
jgi:hypothetical protein